MSLALLGVMAWSEAMLGRADAASDEEKSEAQLSDAELLKIQRKLEQLTETHQQLLKTLAEIKSELAVVKVRVTN